MSHKDKVEKLVEQYKKAHGAIALQKETSDLFRPLENAHFKLDVKDFTQVLSVENGVVDVEGMTPMETLARETLKAGYIPQVTIELKTITVGGAVSGIALESSSFKYGLFHESVIEMEVLVPTGEVVICSPTQNSDLFYALPNSYGTLGYILRLKIKLIKAKKYVKTKHIKYTDMEKCLNDLEKLSDPKSEHDFIDGVVFDKENAVLNIGTLTDDAPFVSDYTYLETYYKSLLKKDEDYLTTYNFLFRWDSDWWWGTKGTLFEHKFFRLLAGRKFLNSKFYLKVMRFLQKYPSMGSILLLSGKAESVIQDIGIPPVNWKKYLDFLLNDVRILPIWLCPFLGSSDFKLFPLENKTYLDFGFWGDVPKSEEGTKWNRLVEQKTFEMKGIKSLYSDVTYTEDEFWRNTDREAYEKVKKKYDPEGRLKTLYEKVTNH